MAASGMLWLSGWIAPLSLLADVEAIDSHTPWRAYLVTVAALSREDGELQMQIARRWSPFGATVSGGLRGASWPSLLCLRTAFGIADPRKATDLKLTIRYLGGAIVYVNGQEVARGRYSN